MGLAEAQLRLLPAHNRLERVEDSKYVREHAAILALKEQARQNQAEIRRIARSLYRSCIEQLALPLDAESEIDLSDMTVPEMYGMHEKLLLHSLHLLNDSRTAKDRKHEILSWIAAPIVGCNFDFGEHLFSFQACAIACNCDSETLQDSILIDIVPKLGIGR